MSRPVLLSELRARVRDRADIENATLFISDTRLDEYINQSIAGLYDLLIESQLQDFYVTRASISLPAGASDATHGIYPLPADFYLMRRVEWVVGDQRFELQPISMHELREWDTAVFSPDMYRFGRGPKQGGYRLGGSVAATGVYSPHIWFPTSWSGTVDIYYIPLAPVLAQGSHSWDGFNGWEEWVVLDAAIKVAHKEEREHSDLAAAREKVEHRIRSLSAARDMGFPELIAEVEGYD